jgi:solute carrier family 45 protein 1/2/4
MGLVWAAGPLSGAFGQAYFGICSDQSRCSWGKRRPYIATGSACIIISLLALAWTTEIAHFIARGLGYRESQTVIRNTTKVMATVCVYGLNLAIQPVQGGMRALFVDNCPTDQLDDASAWAARMTGIGNLLGYGSGFVNLPVILPILGDTQFKVLSVLSSCMLAVTISILCLSVQERDPSSDGHLDHRLSNLAGKFRHIFSGLTQMPPEIVKVCKVQFAAWSAWFVFLYYITT